MAREGKAPAFQFYASDWLADLDVRAMSLAERGAYIDLLAFAWREGSIPTAVEKCARLVGEPLETFRELWITLRPRFEERPGDRLVSSRQEAQRSELKKFVNAQKRKGKRSAELRAERVAASQPEVNRGSTAVQPEVNSASATASASADQKETHSRAHARDPVCSAETFEQLFVGITKRPSGDLHSTVAAARLCSQTAEMESADGETVAREALVAYLAVLSRWRAKGMESAATVPKFVEHYAKILDERSGCRPIALVTVNSDKETPLQRMTRLNLAERDRELFGNKP